MEQSRGLGNRDALMLLGILSSGLLSILLPRQESFASLHILTRRASEGSEALPSLAGRVRMSFFGARVIIASLFPSPWVVARYVERNALGANLVLRAEEWR